MPQVLVVDVENDNPQYDFGSHIRRMTVPVKSFCDLSCPDKPACEGCSDQMFAYLVDTDDIIHLQWNFEDYFNDNPEDPDLGWNEDGSTHWLELDLMNPNGTVAQADLTSQQYVQGFAVGHSQGLNYQNVNVIMEELLPELSSDCFYFRVKVCRAGITEPDFTAEGYYQNLPDAEDFNNGDYVLVSNGPSGYALYYLVGGIWAAVNASEGDLIYVEKGAGWYEIDENGDPIQIEAPGRNQNCDLFNYCYSDMYKLIDCEKTVKFRSVANGKACDGKHYGFNGVGANSGNPNTSFTYVNEFRIQASFEKTCYLVETTRADTGKIISSEKREQRRLRSWGIPERVASRIADTVMMEGFTIDDFEWDDIEDICKNNDEGSDWYIDTQLTATQCSSEEEC